MNASESRESGLLRLPANLSPIIGAVVVIAIARSLIAYLDIDAIKLADSPIPSTIPRLINLVAGLAPFVLGTSLDVLGRFNFG